MNGRVSCITSDPIAIESVAIVEHSKRTVRELVSLRMFVGGDAKRQW